MVRDGRSVREELRTLLAGCHSAWDLHERLGPDGQQDLLRALFRSITLRDREVEAYEMRRERRKASAETTGRRPRRMSHGLSTWARWGPPSSPSCGRAAPPKTWNSTARRKAANILLQRRAKILVH